MLKGKKAIITGSSRGIGKEIVKVFLEQGCEVFGLCTKPSASKEELTKLAIENHTQFTEIYADCGNSDDLTVVVKEALATSGGFDILVNNAGITKDGLSFRMKLEDWESVLKVNLTSTFLISQIISNDMIKKRRGSIINMSSIVGLHGQGGQVNYSASKAGLIGFTKSLAKEVASRGIRVNAIAPGFIDTQMTQSVKEEARNVWLETIPMKKAGSTRDVANTALFLASDMSTYITAQVIGVDGGMGA